MPTAADVAETLGTTAEQVEQMLHEVRSRVRPVQKAKARERIPASSARTQRAVTLALSLYLLSPIPLAFVDNHFGNRNLKRSQQVQALYSPLSWLHDNTALRVPIGWYGKMLERL